MSQIESDNIHKLSQDIQKVFCLEVIQGLTQFDVFPAKIADVLF